MSRQQNPLIQVKDLKKYYPVKTGIIPHVTDYVKAVDGVSFSIYEGEILGLVGESGCGKTTIGKLLTGLEKPTEGAILYRGMDILDWTAKEQKKYRTKIQMIFQDPYSSLNPRKHIYEILAAPMLYHGISDKQTVEKDVKELLEMVGMPQSALGRYPHEFSGGQRQRIGIARALSLKPEFIVCDEPVSALDVSVQAQIMELLKRLQKEFRMAVLLITHDMGVVSHMADRVLVMYAGQIVEEAQAEELFHHPSHPYTRALLSAIPTTRDSEDRKLSSIPGMVPENYDTISGCRFADRCPYTRQECHQRIGLREISKEHTVRCILQL